MNSLHDWFQTPPGRQVLDWERARFDAALADVFGYHALQLGLPGIDALAANRMPHRWLALTAPPPAADPAVDPVAAPDSAPSAPAASQRSAVLVCDSTALPFAEASLDLVALPHTLELSADPHATLREVQRVLVHEGKVAIAGLNPARLWGRRRSSPARPLPPGAGEFIGHWRLRDWLRLLQFELESVIFCDLSAARPRWLERLGEYWGPIFGPAYFMIAVKRTPGAKWVGAAWRRAPAVTGAPAPVANRAVTDDE